MTITLDTPAGTVKVSSPTVVYVQTSLVMLWVSCPLVPHEVLALAGGAVTMAASDSGNRLMAPKTASFLTVPLPRSPSVRSSTNARYRMDGNEPEQ
jgi:hypothetical protein